MSGLPRQRGERTTVRERLRSAADPREDDAVAERDVEETFRLTVDEGRRRMSRRLGPLVATGLVGGIDVGTGVLALLLVEHATGSKLLGGLAFSVGFTALALARSELFTEDFLVPVTSHRPPGPLRKERQNPAVGVPVGDSREVR